MNKGLALTLDRSLWEGYWKPLPLVTARLAAIVPSRAVTKGSGFKHREAF
jgi:hypothetical protein